MIDPTTAPTTYGDDGPGRPDTWADHAGALEPVQLAYALARAYLAPDESAIGAVTARLREIHESPGWAEPFAEFEGQLITLVIEFGHKLFGNGLDAVLAARMDAVAGHIAGYRPATPDGPR